MLRSFLFCMLVVITRGDVISVNEIPDESNNSTQDYEGPENFNNTSPLGIRVTNGNIVTNRADYPSVVWFPDISCGGSIINNYYILTAAHCLVEKERVGDRTTTKILDIESVYYNVRTGMLRRGERQQLPNENTVQQRIIKRVEIHPNYDPNTQENDIGIVQLCQPFDLTASNNVLAVNGFGRSLQNVEPIGTVVGWGVVDRLDPVNKPSAQRPDSEQLRAANQRMIGPDDCRTRLQNYVLQGDPAGQAAVRDNARFIFKTQICGLEVRSGQGQCKGDSGGPLYCSGLLNGARTQLQCGLVTFGAACGYNGVPGVYTSFYENSIYNWMLGAIKRTTCNNLPRPSKSNAEPLEKCKLRYSQPC